MKVAYRVVGHGVSGVQHTGFRRHVFKIASENGVTANASNLPDSTVQVLLEGDEQSIKAVSRELRRGSPLSRVLGLIIEALEG